MRPGGRGARALRGARLAQDPKVRTNTPDGPMNAARAKHLANYKATLLHTLGKELVGGPVVVKVPHVGRFEVRALDGDVIDGVDAEGRHLRLPFQCDMGLTGARVLADPDSRDWWIMFGPSWVFETNKPDLDELSDDFEPSLSQQVEKSRRALNQDGG